MQVLSFLILFFSLNSLAQLNSTPVPGVDKSKLESAIEKQMDVYKVEILEIKPIKFMNLIGEVIETLSGDDTHRMYKISLFIDESFFNSNQHGMKCTLIDYPTSNKLFIDNCKSATASATSMWFDKGLLK